MVRSNSAASLALALVSFSLSTAVFAEEGMPGGHPVEWDFSVAPYLFLPLATEGTSTVAGTSVDLDMDLSDVLDVLDVAFSTRLEAWRGRVGMAADIYYVNLSLSKGAILEPRANPGLGITADLTVDVDVRQGWSSVVGMYRLLEPEGAARYPVAVDLLLGTRWNYLKQEVDAALDIAALPGIQTQLGGSENWWEPTLGFRAGTRVSSCLTLGLRAEAGGFGAGGNDLQWVVLAGAERAFGANKALRFGYQFYSIDYSAQKSDGAFAYDVEQHGPYAAFVWRW